MPKLENNIGWCDATGNKVIGCAKVSAGCKHCYAQFDTPARVLRHRGIETWGDQAQRVKIAGFSKKARRLNQFGICDRCRELVPADDIGGVHDGRFETTCGGALRRIRFFANSNSDWLDDRWPIEIFADFLKDIHDCPNLDWQLLTKRPENFQRRTNEVVSFHIRKPEPLPTEFVNWVEAWRKSRLIPHQAWIGASVENQQAADDRIPHLLQIPAAIRFLSCEPLLGPVDLGYQFPDGTFTRHVDHWVICGGESGKDARPMHPSWALSLRDQCAAAGVPFYFKQWGEWCPRGPESCGYVSVDGVERIRLTDTGANGHDLGASGFDQVWMNRAGVHRTGRKLEGAEHLAFPR